MVFCSKSDLVLSDGSRLRARLECFQALAVLALLACPLALAQTPIEQNTVRLNRVATASPQEESDAQPLEPGKRFEREINPGETHTYLLRCEAGQFTEVEVAQRGSNVALVLFGIDGKLILSLNNIDDVQGEERLPVLAYAAGTYRIAVLFVGRRTETGGYEMNVSQSRVATRRDNDYMAAELLIQEARHFVAQGTSQSKRNAIAKYRDALPLLRSAGDREREGTVLNNIGLFYRTLGELSNSLDFHIQALAIRTEIGDHRGEAISLDHLGSINVALGDPQKGIDFYNRALVLERANKNRRGEANTLSNIGEVYFDLGETERALDFYTRSLPLYRAIGGRPREALALTRIGAVYFSRGEYEKALEYYQQALTLQQRLEIRSAVADTNHQIGILYAKLGTYEKAFEFLNRALDFARKIGNRSTEAESLTILGEVYQNTGEKQRAREYLNQALPFRRESGDLQGEARTLYWLAVGKRDEGRLADALDDIESALKIVENVRGRIASHELRASYSSTIQKYYDVYIDVLFELHQRDPSAGYDGAALRASERARARGLLELLSEMHADIRRGVEPVLLDRLRALRQQLNSRAENQLLLLSGEHTNEQAKKLAAELNALANQYDDVQTQIRRTSPHYAALTQPPSLALKEIQQSLDKDTLLLEYKLGERRSFVWAVTPTTISVYELPGRVEVEKVARLAYELLTARNQRSQDETIPQRGTRLAHAEEEYEKVAAELSRILLSPVKAHLKVRRLLVVSDGALQYLPFAALPKPDTEDTEPGLEKSNKDSSATHRLSSRTVLPLIADHEIISLPSASVITVLREELHGRTPAPRTIAVLADPVFDKDDARVIRRAVNHPQDGSTSVRSVSNEGDIAKPGGPAANVTDGTDAAVEGQLRLPRLAFSRREAEAILASAPAQDRMAAFSFQASRATALSPELARYRFVHFATHSLLNSDRPELSAIVLSLVDEGGRPRNGFIRLNEIYNLNLPVELVMLSACQTGLGKEIRGEGLIGLTRGFMYAGAPRVGASLWKVDDAATAALMERFYQAMLREGKTSSSALRAAQLDMMKQKRWRSPYFWAAFILQGEWK